MSEFLEPFFLELLGTIIAAAIAWASMAFTKATGIQIEARHRDALHSAVITFAEGAVSEGITDASDALVSEAKNYIRASVPDAIDALSPDNAILRHLLNRYIKQALDRFGVVAELQSI